MDQDHGTTAVAEFTHGVELARHRVDLEQLNARASRVLEQLRELVAETLTAFDRLDADTRGRGLSSDELLDVHQRSGSLCIIGTLAAVGWSVQPVTG